MACDLLIAADTARFGQPEVNLGIIPGYGGTQRLPRLVGRNRAKEMVLTGEMISAQRAYEIGLVNKVVPAAELMGAAREIARKILSRAPVAVRTAKMAMNRGLDLDLHHVEELVEVARHHVRDRFGFGQEGMAVGDGDGEQGVRSLFGLEVRDGELIKFIQRRPDGLETESVVIPMRHRDGSVTRTLCVSSQVGCAMGCTFCASGMHGLERNLTSAEVVEQAVGETDEAGQVVEVPQGRRREHRPDVGRQEARRTQA